MRKSNGPSTVPWGTPERTGAESDSSPSTTTDICLPVRKACIQELTGPVTPEEANLPRSCTWETVSKAWLKSSIPTSTCMRLSKDLKRSLKIIRSCISQEGPLRNPSWAWVRTLFSSRKFKICRPTICSNILHTASSCASSLSTLSGKRSRPDALWGFSFKVISHPIRLDLNRCSFNWWPS